MKQIYVNKETENSENVGFYSFRNIMMHLSRLDTEINTKLHLHVYIARKFNVTSGLRFSRFMYHVSRDLSRHLRCRHPVARPLLTKDDTYTQKRIQIPSR
jgi:hypothetical protein